MVGIGSIDWFLSVLIGMLVVMWLWSGILIMLFVGVGGVVVGGCIVVSVLLLFVVVWVEILLVVFLGWCRILSVCVWLGRWWMKLCFFSVEIS